MTRNVLMASLLVWGCAVGSTAVAAPCTTDTLAAFDTAYDGTSGCTIGGLALSDFSIEVAPGAGLVSIDPSTIALTPVAGGLSIDAANAVAAAAGELLGLRFGFRLTPPAPAAFAGLLELGASSVAPDGAVTAIAFDGATPLATVFDIGIDSDHSEPLVLPVSSFFDIFVEITIDGGPSNAGGSARLGPNLGRITFGRDGGSTVPEPGTFALVVLALLALARRRAARITTF